MYSPEKKSAAYDAGSDEDAAENNVTNLTYKKILENIEQEKKAKSPDKFKSGEFADLLEGKDDSDAGEDHDDEESTDASANSDSEDNAKGSEPRLIIFSGSGNFIKYWNNLVIILAMYNSLVIPLQLFYGDKGHSVLNSSTVKFIDACVDLLFLIDIIIKFRTSFLDPKQSIEVKDSGVIARKYIRGSFTIDFISSVPFNSLIQSSQGVIATLIELLGLLKLLRLTRLYVTVQRLDTEQEIKVYLKILMMTIILLVFIHVLSCIWFLVVSKQERWVQNMDFMYAADSQAYQGFHEGDDVFWRKYFVLLYTGFYIFGVGEIVPRVDASEFFSAFLLCSFCTIINALIIGYMTSYVEELNKKTAELSEKLNLTNTAMLNLNLSRGLKKEITQYIY